MGTGTKTNRTMKQVQCRAGQPPGCRKFRMLSVVLLLTRGSLHCIVPNDEIMKFNKWSVVKFIFHRLVRYNEDDFPSEYQWHNNRIKYS